MLNCSLEQWVIGAKVSDSIIVHSYGKGVIMWLIVLWASCQNLLVCPVLNAISYGNSGLLKVYYGWGASPPPLYGGGAHMGGRAFFIMNSYLSIYALS
jgi:hypothetical protein